MAEGIDVTLRKERPSVFVTTAASLLGAGGIAALITALISLITNLGSLELGKLVALLVTGVAMAAIAAFVYDRSAQRANAINAQKINEAARDESQTVELKN